jgi:hypothetical protein
MQDSVKIGAAALGGYVLGRTKKAKLALTLALWLTGQGRMRDAALSQAARALQSERGQELLDQFAGPMLSKGRNAALTVFEKQAGRAGDALQRRNEQLAEALGRAGGSGANGRGPSPARPATRSRRTTPGRA